MVNIDDVRKNLVRDMKDILKSKGYDVEDNRGIRIPFKADGNDVVANVCEYDKYTDMVFDDDICPHIILFTDDSFFLTGVDDKGNDFEYLPRNFTIEALTDFREEINKLPQRKDAEYSALGLAKGDEIDWYGNSAEVEEISEWGDTWTLKLSNGAFYLAKLKEVLEQNPDLESEDWDY